MAPEKVLGLAKIAGICHGRKERYSVEGDIASEAFWNMLVREMEHMEPPAPTDGGNDE